MADRIVLTSQTVALWREARPLILFGVICALIGGGLSIAIMTNFVTSPAALMARIVVLGERIKVLNDEAAALRIDMNSRLQGLNETIDGLRADLRESRAAR